MKLKMFNFDSLKAININSKECKQYIHTLVLPTGYFTTPFLHYTKNVQDYIVNYIKEHCQEQYFYLNIVIKENVNKDDFKTLYNMIETAFVHGLCMPTMRHREAFLGVPSLVSHLTSGMHINMKRLLNNQTRCDTVGFTVIAPKWKIFKQKQRFIK